MYIEIENLGPIKKGGIELKPLTVFIGPNNTGKTYLAYLISGLCRDFFIRRHIFALIRRKRKPVYTLTERHINDLLEKGQIEIKINLKDILTENFEYITSIFKRLNEGSLPTEKFAGNFWKFLGSDKKELFDDLRIAVRVSEIYSFDEIENIIYSRPSYIRLATLFERTLLRATVFKDPKSHQAHIKLRLSIEQRIHEDKQGAESVTSDQINQFLSRTILLLIVGIALQPIISSVSIFPAQRNTLVLDFIRSAINIASREESPDFVVSDPGRLIRSKPILDFLKMIDLVSEDIKSKYYDLGLKLEETLGGRVIVSIDNKGEKEIRFVINDNKDLKLITTSSMVQQLSSLALYLKHQAGPGDLIVIDEPESNLHPKAQTKIIEIIAEMVNRGLWVIVTTHSCDIPK